MGGPSHPRPRSADRHRRSAGRGATASAPATSDGRGRVRPNGDFVSGDPQSEPDTQESPPAPASRRSQQSSRTAARPPTVKPSIIASEGAVGRRGRSSARVAAWEPRELSPARGTCPGVEGAESLASPAVIPGVGRTAKAQITAGNHVSSIRTARSAFLALGRYLIPPAVVCGENWTKWRESRPLSGLSLTESRVLTTRQRNPRLRAAIEKS